MTDKVIIVEGNRDRKKVLAVLAEDIEIICTNGTIGLEKLDELVESLEDKDVYILVDADESGEKLRRQLRRELPNAEHLYIDRVYREVEDAPARHIAEVLTEADILVKSFNQ
ncbi:TOPRIM domain-containing protein [Bacillus sp. FJAT-27916]|uniref:toprim domain-containing protein n=1 Tax=Bacillaceae TaxID=186817 RepID=UPI000670EE5B|nr:toprim domain-containing protein [Bacillus sp. FJAT-27916]KMY43249.1 TOPRIM domain-containing protein [Bacillus sp. FJAT-27916]